MIRFGLTMFTAALLAGAPAAAQAPAAEGLKVAPVPVRPMPDGFTLAAVGDLIYLRPMLPTLARQSADMLKILADADATFGNFETTAVDLETFQGAPQAQSGGTWMIADPRVTDDLKAIGFDLLSHANNHATDWGVEGMLETGQRLAASGLTYAGTGRNLSSARAPRYVDLPEGRVAMVAASSSFTAMSPAADALGEAPGRPGVNMLRTTSVGVVAPADLEVLARLAGRRPGEARVRFNGATYKASPTALGRMELEFELNPRDVEANLRAIRQGRQNSNFMLVSVHSHQPGNDSPTPALFLKTFARQAIDAGADAFVAHGPHQLRGVEVYKGKPIFYSLGNFAMMNNSLDVAPADMFDAFGVDPATVTTPEMLQARNERSFADRNLYESVIAVSRYDGGEVSEIRFYPIDLGVMATGAAKGVPKLADREVGQVVLERLQKLSGPYGVRIAIEKGVGVWRKPGG